MLIWKQTSIINPINSEKFKEKQTYNQCIFNFPKARSPYFQHGCAVAKIFIITTEDPHAISFQNKIWVYYNPKILNETRNYNK